MAHIHSVYDSDAHFSINPITRALKNEATSKTSLIQYDHNSERFTFEIPRMIEGHDMSLCNHIRVHYINIDAKTKAQASGVYEVEDMQISPESDDVVICSWLISRNCTQLVGSLNFLIRFCCVTDGFVDYAWNTATYTGISVSSGIDADETFKDDYVDIIEQWKADVMRVFDDQVKQIADETKASMEAFSKEMKGDVTAWKEAESAGIHNDLVLMGSRVDELAAMRGQGDVDYEYIHDPDNNITAHLYTNGVGVYLHLHLANTTIAANGVISLPIPEKLEPIANTVLHNDEVVTVEILQTMDKPDMFGGVITEPMQIRIENDKAQDVTTTTDFYGVYLLRNPAFGELVDIRAGLDGTVYDCAGTAIREQLAKVNAAIDDDQVSKNYTWSSDKVSKTILDTSNGLIEHVRTVASETEAKMDEKLAEAHDVMATTLQVGDNAIHDVLIQTKAMENDADGNYSGVLDFAPAAYQNNKVILRNIAPGKQENDAVTKGQMDRAFGDLESALDNIIAIQNGLLRFSFYVSAIEYFAEHGMTWREFINSDYNDGSFSEGFIDDGEVAFELVMVDETEVYLDGKFVPLDDRIIENGNYSV